MKENILNNPVKYNRAFYAGYIKTAILFCFFSLAGCTARKKLIVKTPVKDSTAEIINVNAVKLEAIRAGQNKFDTFSGRAHTKLDINGNSNDVTLNIRIKSGQKIWVSVTAFAGIEAARALITPDSIKLLNRLQGIYLKKPFSYINKLAGNQINFKTLQALLTGNAVPELINENAVLTTHGDTTTLNGNLDSLAYKLVIGPGMKVAQTYLSNLNESQWLRVLNTMFVQLGNRAVPSQIDIKSMVKNKKIQVNLRYGKFDFDQPLEYPFNIPSGYDEGN